MSLEKIVEKEKPGFFTRLKNKIAPYLVSAVIGIGSLAGCRTEQYERPYVSEIDDIVTGENNAYSISFYYGGDDIQDIRLENAPPNMEVRLKEDTGFQVDVIEWHTSPADVGSYDVTLVVEAKYFSAYEDFTVIVNNAPRYNIAYVSDEGGNYNLRMMDENGNNELILTNDTGQNFFALPGWSPDGKKMLYTSNIDGDLDIFAVDITDSNITQLTDYPGEDVYPAWSPDGTKILFYSKKDDPMVGDIYIMDADGSNVQRLTFDGGADYASFSPDGTKIVFNTHVDGGLEIFVMDADGSNQTRLTNNTVHDGGPRWSPDGTKIVFNSTRDGNTEYYIMNADGSNQTNITNYSGPDYYAVISPDSSRAVFTSNRDGDFDLYLVDIDGSNLEKLVDNVDEWCLPDWMPDGTKIAYEANRTGNVQIYIIDIDGTNETQLTFGSYDNFCPLFSPNKPTFLNHAPNLDYIANQNINDKFMQLIVPLSATDLNEDYLTYSLENEPSGMAINQNNEIEWLNHAPGDYTITVKVNDPYGGEDSQDVNIHVEYEPIF